MKRAGCVTLSLISCFVFLSPTLRVFAENELSTPEIVQNPEVKLLDTEGAGKLYQVGEHLVCVMEGTPEEMGFQHGRLLAKRIQHVTKEGYVVKAIWERGYTREYVNAQSARMEKHFPPEYIVEMKGVVKGLRAAGIEDITYEDVRLSATQAELLHYGPDSPPGNPDQIGRAHV